MPIRGLTDRPATFPEIGRIRKGAPKETNRPGKDLTYFRVVFDESETEAAQEFGAAYGEQPRVIQVVLPFDHIPDVWDAWVEAYVAGGLVHRSDGDTIEYHIDPLTGDRTVKDGEPRTECPSKNGKRVAQYIGANDKTKDLFAAPVGRLKVIIPALQRFAFLTLVTTSQYDIGNISSQLQALKDVHGRIAGIPLILQRKPRMVSVPMPDGKRTRLEKWLISVEADPSWVSAKLAAMGKAALPEVVKGYLVEPEAMDDAQDGEFTPEWEEDVPGEQTHPDLEDEINQIGGEVVASAAVTRDQAKANLEAAADRGDPAVTAAVVADANDASLEELEAAAQHLDEATGEKTSRPYSPHTLKEKLDYWVEFYKGTRKDQKKGTMELWQFARWQLGECFAGDKASDVKCHSVSNFLFGKVSSKDWTGAEAQAIAKWLDPTENATGDLVPSDVAKAEAVAIVIHTMKEAGQEEMNEG